MHFVLARFVLIGELDERRVGVREVPNLHTDFSLVGPVKEGPPSLISLRKDGAILYEKSLPRAMQTQALLGGSARRRCGVCMNGDQDLLAEHSRRFSPLPPYLCVGAELQSDTSGISGLSAPFTEYGHPLV